LAVQHGGASRSGKRSASAQAMLRPIVADEVKALFA
jgi:hypothetical protein